MSWKLTLFRLGSEDAFLLSSNLFSFFLGVADLDIAFFRNTAVWDFVRFGVESFGESNSENPVEGEDGEVGVARESLDFPFNFFLLGVTIS